MTRNLHNLVGTRPLGFGLWVVSAEQRTRNMPVQVPVHHPGFYSPKAALQPSLQRLLVEGLFRRAGR
jgi:hypothetical protein